MADTKHLIERRGLWLFNWRVPSDCIDAFDGKKTITKSLETHSLRTAQQRRSIALADCLKVVNEVRSANAGDPKAHFRLHLKAMENTEGERLQDAWSSVEDTNPTDPFDIGFKEALKVTHLGHDSELAKCTLKDALKAYKEDREGKVQAKSLSHASRAVDTYLEYVQKDDVILEDIKRKDVKEYIKITTGTNSGKTVSNRLTFLSSIFKVALDDELIPEDKRNPFEGHRVSRKDTKSFERFSDAELKAIFKGTEKYKGKRRDHHKYLLPRLAYATGCRAEELCSLQRAQIKTEGDITFIAIAEGVDVYEGKTINAGRRIPIHSSLVDEILQWRDSSDHKYLFPELESNRADGKMSDKYSKSFGRFKKTFDITERSKAFHSFRVHMATNLERAEIPENRAVWVLGHTRTLSLSYGLYSDGPSLEQLSEDVEKAVVWP